MTVPKMEDGFIPFTKFSRLRVNCFSHKEETEAIIKAHLVQTAVRLTCLNTVWLDFTLTAQY